MEKWNCRAGALWFVLACVVGLPPAPARADDGDSKPQAEAQQRLREAQQRLDEDARQVAELSMAMGADPERIERRVRIKVAQRAMLGVGIDMSDDDAGEGVRVLNVSPGGPADAAGLRVNDRITSLGGTDLGKGGRDGAAKRLLERMHEAWPGVPLAVEYRRDGKLLKAKLVPKESGELLALQGPGMPPDLDMDIGPGLHDLPMLAVLGAGRHGLGATQLVELTPGLGSYFGTDKGLLIVRAPEDARYKLQDGDVLLDIDGRVPAGVAHALQILGSYRQGETAHLHVMRQKQRVELAVEVPAG
jgi:hypothetical protein